jgi:CHASE3 domain sensor protein
VTRTAFNLGLDRLAIRSRILGGFAVVLALLGILAVISLRGTGVVERQSARVEESSQMARLIASLATQVDDACTRVIQYALSENDGDLNAAQQALAQLQKSAADLGTIRTDNEQQRTSIARIGESQAQYAAVVDQTIKAIGGRREKAAALTKAATDLRTIVSAIAPALVREKVAADVMEKALRLSEAFHTSSGAATRFLASRNPADAAAARADFDAMRQSAEAVKAGTTESRRVQRFVQAMGEPSGQFEKALSGLVAVTAQIEQATAAREAAGHKLLEAVAEFRKGSIAEQRDSLAAMQGAVQSSRNLGLLTSGGALAIGLVLAWLIGSGIHVRSPASRRPCGSLPRETSMPTSRIPSGATRSAPWRMPSRCSAKAWRKPGASPRSRRSSTPPRSSARARWLR